MKVLCVNATLDPVAGGGTAERTFQMSRFLAQSGAQCRVLTLDIGIDAERLIPLADVEVVRLKCLSERFYLFVPDPRMEDAVAWANVVHIMGHWTLINAVVYCACRKHARPYVFCPAGALPIFGRSRLLKTLYNALIGRRIARNAAACVAVGTNEVEEFRSYGVSPGRVTTIPNGVDPADFAGGDPRPFTQRIGVGNAPFVLFMGRLNEIKGPDLLLRAFDTISQRFPDLHLVFAGPDGGMLSMLRALVRRSRLENRVHFAGPVMGADKALAYRAAQLLAIPSRQEAMSIVALEAGISGTPVLMTDRCGWDGIEAAGGGRIVPATVEGLESGLAFMLGAVERLPAMGARLEAYTRAHFLWDAIAARYLETFERIAGASAQS